jgi:hypothetical protein
VSSLLVSERLLELSSGDEADWRSVSLPVGAMEVLLESSVPALSAGALTLPLAPGSATGALLPTSELAGAAAEPLVFVEAAGESLCANACAAVKAPAARTVTATFRMLMVFLLVPDWTRRGAVRIAAKQARKTQSAPCRTATDVSDVRGTWRERSERYGNGDHTFGVAASSIRAMRNENTAAIIECLR